MKKRYWLWERNGVFYLDDSVTRQKESLHTRDKREAERIRDARNEAVARPTLGIALAKAYLSAHDSEVAKRTWQDVIDRLCAQGKPQTQEHRRRVSNRQPQCLLKNMKVIETTADDLMKILKAGGVMTNAFVRGLHNLAVGVGWLPMPILPPKLWPTIESKPKRGVTTEEHEKIISTECNGERKLYYKLLWEIGAAQSDAALLKAENIDWKDRTLSFQRLKTGSWCHVKIGSRLEILLRQLPRQGMLFPKWGNTTNKDRAAEFRRRCRLLKLDGISLHSYRYAWAERAKTAGYPERFAQEALGHNSRAWAQSYSKRAHVVLPPLEDYEDKIIQLHSQNAAKNEVQKKGIGAGAARLNLRDEVGLEDFLKLCRNVNPATGELLTQRMKVNRRVFYDFTLSPPKSVSIVALVAGDNLRVARTRKFAAARVRKNGASNYRNTGNIVGAVFRHDASRALDPHLHCHCIIFNATYDNTERQWKALETYEMLQAAKFAENLYYHELARQLRRLGYQFQNNKRGDFEINGISPELIERFSKRHSEIDKETRKLLEQEPDKRGQNLKEIRERVAHDRRARKIKDIGRKRLAELWGKQITNEEKTALAGLKQIRQANHVEKFAGVERSVAWAEQHLFDRRSVVNEFELWRYALEHGRGENFSLKNLQSLTERKSYVRNEAQRGKITTRATLERERRLVAAAENGRKQFEPFNGNHRIQNASLDAEQRDATKQILASQDFVTLFRGGAGTGKSFTLKEVRSGLLQAGQGVHVIAPQRQQVLDLQKDLDCRGATLSEFLTRGEMERGAVVVVDEAGQIGAKQMLQLFEVVQANGGRLILSGDTRQHGAVEASDAMRAIEKFAGLSAIELKTIRRQNPELAKTKAERKAIEEYKLAVVEARNGQLAASFNRLNKNGAIVQCGTYEQQKFLADKFLELAAKEHSTVVVSQTWSELQKVNEQIRAGLKSRGLIGQNEAVVTALEKLDLTDAQKRDARFYSDKSVVVFNQNVAGVKQGTLGRLVQIEERELYVEAAGKIRPVAFEQLERLSVCEPKELALASGDRLQLNACHTP